MNFLDAVVKAAQASEDGGDVEFLKSMLDTLREGKINGTVGTAKLKLPLEDK
jgi:hypothetical protein